MYNIVKYYSAQDISTISTCAKQKNEEAQVAHSIVALTPSPPLPPPGVTIIIAPGVILVKRSLAGDDATCRSVPGLRDLRNARHFNGREVGGQGQKHAFL